MPFSLIPEFEVERLQELRSFDLQAISNEEKIAVLLEIAANKLNVPFGAVSLMEEKHQKVLVSYGFTNAEIPRNTTPCSITICGTSPIVFADISGDPRWRGNGIDFCGHNIKFYVGIPLLTPSGLAIGTLCLFDRSPKSIDASCVTYLERVAQIIVALFELRRMKKFFIENCVERARLDSLVQRSQAELIEANRLNHLHRVFSEMVHEITTPLTTIQLSTEEALESMEAVEDLEFAESLSRIKCAATAISTYLESANNLCERPMQPSLEIVPILDIVNNAINLCRPKFRQSGIKVIVECTPEATAVGESGPLTQVLLNLLMNSSQAVSGSPNPWIKIAVSHSDGMAIVRVTDSGPGIDKQIVPKLMQPFFTTKSPDVGKGLGLSISEQIIQKYGGRLWFDPDSRNTTFAFCLMQKMSTEAAG